MKDADFIIRGYGKTELAMLYFPECTKKGAWKNLKYWMSINPTLRKLMGKRGKMFTPKEVRMIVKILGEPTET